MPDSEIMYIVCSLNVNVRMRERMPCDVVLVVQCVAAIAIVPDVNRDELQNLEPRSLSSVHVMAANTAAMDTPCCNGEQFERRCNKIIMFAIQMCFILISITILVSEYQQMKTISIIILVNNRKLHPYSENALFCKLPSEYDHIS